MVGPFLVHLVGLFAIVPLMNGGLCCFGSCLLHFGFGGEALSGLFHLVLLLVATGLTFLVRYVGEMRLGVVFCRLRGCVLPGCLKLCSHNPLLSYLWSIMMPCYGKV